MSSIRTNSVASSALAALFAITAITSLTACGGGSSASAPAPVAVIPTPPAPPPPPPPPPPDPLTPQISVPFSDATTTFAVATEDIGGDGGGDGGVGGGAGDGSPIKRAVVVVTDRTGATRTGSTNDEGNYFVRFPSSFVSPIVVKVVDVGGNALASATAEATGPGKVLRVNVNPLTDKMVSDALASTVAGTDKPLNGSQVDGAKLEAARMSVVESIRAALGVAGVTKTDLFDPVKSVYKYDGTGIDAVIESITHSRNAQTGATELRAKLAGLNNNADGVVQPVLISATTPLATTQVAINANPVLTFTKINAWLDEVNRCLALTQAQYALDANCVDANGTRLVASNFLNNSRDYLEDFRTLYSDTGTKHIEGSTMRNPTILAFAKSSPGVAIDDTAIVEVTIRQPRTGPLSDNLVGTIEYTKVLTFLRNDALTAAKAGNWILQGNRLALAASVSTRYERNVQVNPAMAANVAGQSPSRLETRLLIDLNQRRFDAATRTYVSAGIRALRVKGPGLPSAGLVMSPNTIAGATWMGALNKTGAVPSVAPTTNGNSPNFNLAAALIDGSPIYSSFWNGSSAGYRDAPLTDFSSMQAFAAYTFELFLASTSSTTVPDTTMTVYNFASVASPVNLVGVPVNDISPSQLQVTAPKPAIAAATSAHVTVTWVNNPNAAPVNQVRTFGAERSPKGALSNFTTRLEDRGSSVAGAFSLSARPTAAAVRIPTGLPSLGNGTPGDNRFVSVWANQGRAVVINAVRWDNNPTQVSGWMPSATYEVYRALPGAVFLATTPATHVAGVMNGLPNYGPVQLRVDSASRMCTTDQPKLFCSIAASGHAISFVDVKPSGTADDTFVAISPSMVRSIDPAMFVGQAYEQVYPTDNYPNNFGAQAVALWGSTTTQALGASVFANTGAFSTVTFNTGSPTVATRIPLLNRFVGFTHASTTGQERMAIWEGSLSTNPLTTTSFSYMYREPAAPGYVRYLATSPTAASSTFVANGELTLKPHPSIPGRYTVTALTLTLNADGPPSDYPYFAPCDPVAVTSCRSEVRTGTIRAGAGALVANGSIDSTVGSVFSWNDNKGLIWNGRIIGNQWYGRYTYPSGQGYPAQRGGATDIAIFKFNITN